MSVLSAIQAYFDRRAAYKRHKKADAVLIEFTCPNCEKKVLAASKDTTSRIVELECPKCHGLFDVKVGAA